MRWRRWDEVGARIGGRGVKEGRRWDEVRGIIGGGRGVKEAGRWDRGKNRRWKRCERKGEVR